MNSSKQKYLIHIVILIYAVCQSVVVHAQLDTANIDEAYTAQIRLLSKPMKDSVILRWAPDKPGGWLKCNEAGYNLDRVVVDEDTSYNPEDFIRLNDKPIKPLPLEEWEDIVGENVKDPYAGVAAQMLYGDNDIQGLNWMEKANQFQNQWSFALFAADLSANAANASGLRWVDKTVEPGKVYIYRISSPVNPEEYLILPGLSVVNMEESVPTPTPEIKSVEESEHAIKIKWDRRKHQNLFTAYYVERSTNENGPFKRLTEQPYIHPIAENELVEKKDIIYLDSLNRNYVKYYYRIIGITPFGEVSKPSNVVSGMGRDVTPPPSPSNVKAKAVDNHTIKLTWQMEKTPPDLAGFLIARSHTSDKGFSPLFDEMLPANTRAYTDYNAAEHVDNFYMIAALDTAGNGNLSLSTFGNILDTIPPDPPINLTGHIDTSGVVHLSWQKGDEVDLYGYKVFYSNDPDHEFSQVTRSTWFDTTYTDTVTVHTLTEHVYYKVMAVDRAPNYSGFSKMLELKRPDIVPPTQPVFMGYNIGEKGIRIEWLPSSSHDAIKNQLLRKTDTSDWQIIYSEDTLSNNNFYVDEDVKPNSVYEYTLEAIDDAGLKSGKAYPLRLKMIDFETKPSVKQFFASKDSEQNSINLNWKYPYDGIHKFILFKSINGSNFVTYKQLNKDVLIFSDDHVKTDTTYKYALQVIYEDGKKTPIGKVVEVEY